jgi:hypothetical protein
MTGGQIKTPARGQALPGHDNRYATAADISKVSQVKNRAKRAGTYQIQPVDGEPFTIAAKGREAWALERLMEAGANGCTPITQPAPRWSSYVHKLRERGVPIETIHEPHGGEFSGTHGRYILRAQVVKGKRYE